MTPGDDKNLKGAVATQTPEKEGQTPEQPQTFTKEDVEAAVSKAKSDVRADIGRLEAEWKRSQNIAEKAMSRLKEIEDESYRKQEEAARDDPDALTRLRSQRQLARERAEIEEERTKVRTQLEMLTKTTAKALAQQYNVSEATLLKYGGSDAEGMEELAKSYGVREAGKSQTRMTQQPDDGKTKGGGTGLTIADVKKMSPEEKNRRTAEIAKLSF